MGGGGGVETQKMSFSGMVGRKMGKYFQNGHTNSYKYSNKYQFTKIRKSFII